MVHHTAARARDQGAKESVARHMSAQAVGVNADHRMVVQDKAQVVMVNADHLTNVVAEEENAVPHTVAQDHKQSIYEIRKTIPFTIYTYR